MPSRAWMFTCKYKSAPNQLTEKIHSQAFHALEPHRQRTIHPDFHCVARKPKPLIASFSPPLPPLPSPASPPRLNPRCSPCFMAASMSAAGLKALPSTFHGSWTTSLAGEDRAALTKSVPSYVRVPRPPRSRPRMGNVNEGKGLFAPLVVLTRNILGRKRFNQLRGKAIALHSQVITEFCKTIGADNKQRQGLIRLAKKNGEKLGFLA